NFTFPSGTHVCVVEVDRDTGDVRILRYVAVDDCGKVINPLLVEGQIQGGIAQAIGQALYEEAVYDEAGQLVTGELMDYAIPRASQCPRFETDRVETPSPVNPLGAKGVGEAGTIGATPARRSWSTWAASPSSGGSRPIRIRSRSARTRPTRRSRTPRRSAPPARCSPRWPRTSATGRCGTAGPSAVPSRMRIRPRTGRP